MADSSTNGKGKDEEPAPRNSALSTHESGPPHRAPLSDDLDVLARGATVGRYLVLERLGARSAEPDP